jgi:hypothetical protein
MIAIDKSTARTAAAIAPGQKQSLSTLFTDWCTCLHPHSSIRGLSTAT